MKEGQLELRVCTSENCPVQRQAESHRESKFHYSIVILWLIFMSKAWHIILRSGLENIT